MVPARAAERTDASVRLERVSRSLLGRPYRSAPLGGGPGVPEKLVAGRDAFDCVTYVEMVLAAAFTRGEGDFRRRLCRLRYAGGRVSWEARNHYMVDWLRNARRSGLVREVALGPGSVTRRRLLDVVPGLVPRTRTIRAFPKRLVARAAPKLRTGDLICFASTRAHLDVFHCGLIVQDGGRLLLRHASKSRERVVEQGLFEFLRANRMSGVIVARPVERR